MASNSGAYFEGLQYASQGVEPVKFGELAMGFAKIKEDQRLEAKRDKERRESAQMEMTKLFGEEVYSAFDGTGLKDVDVVTGKIKDSIIARANVLNSMFEKGELTGPQMMQEMTKLSSQSKKISSFASSASDMISKISENTNASAATDFLLQRANQLFQNATPVMDSSGKISFLSKDGDVLTNNPVDELENLLQNRQKVDVNAIAKSIVDTQGQMQRIVQGGSVVKTLGSVGENQRKYIGNLVGAMDQEDIFDIAQQAGIKTEMDPNSVFKIKNIDQVKTEVQKYLENTTQAAFDAKKEVDQVAGKQLSIQQSQEARAQKAAEMSVINVVKDDQGKAIETQASPAPGKTASVRSLLIGNKTIPVANIGKLVVDEKTGAHRATISYEVPIDAPVPDGAEVAPALQKLLQQGEKQTKIITEEVALTDPAVINQIRTQLDMPLLKQQSKPLGADRFNK
jgi:hypothetical protein